MHKKRGQVTAFIILGMLVVASILGVYFARDYVLKSAWERSYEKSLTVPKQAENVKSYIDSCISDITNRGVDLLGQQGGYTVIPEDPVKDPLDKISNALEIFPGFRTAYWYYKSKNNVEIIQKPSLIEMEDELAAYVDANLEDCLGNFRIFEGYEISVKKPKSEVEIKDEEILVAVNFPVSIKLKDFKFDISDFYSRTEKPLGSLFKEASAIYEKENVDMFLEDKVINVLVLNEEIPVTGVSRDCGTKVWVRKDVENAIKKYVSLNIQMLRVKGTEYTLAEPEKEDYYELDLGVINSDSVNFYSSSNWPFELEIIPTEGELLKAERATKNAGALEGLAQSFFCLNYYQFLYNLKWPVLVILSKNGYTFKFATQVVIDKNEARKSSFTPLSIPEIDRSFCDNKQSTFDVYVYDDEGKEVNNAEIKFKCVNMVCYIGETEGNHLREKIPPCVNGIIVANKEGYGTGKAIISTNEAAVVSIEMPEVREINAEVAMSGRTKTNLEESENAMVSMVNSENEFSSFLSYPEQTTLKLIPGDYEVYAYVLKEYPNKITLSGETQEKCFDVPETGIAGWFGAKKEKCITLNIPSMSVDNTIVGGAKFRMHISEDDLKNNEVKFYIPYKGVSRELVNFEVGEDFIYPKFS